MDFRLVLHLKGLSIGVILTIGQEEILDRIGHLDRVLGVIRNFSGYLGTGNLSEVLPGIFLRGKFRYPILDIGLFRHCLAVQHDAGPDRLGSF